MYSTLRPPRSTLFPYTTLFRSQRARARPASRSYTDEVLFECRGVGVDEGRRVLLARARHQKGRLGQPVARAEGGEAEADRKSTRLNSSHANISYAVFCLKKKKR